MGRSKFPGKPTKQVNRTRVNVLSTVVNTTVVDHNNATVGAVEEGDDDSKKIDSPASASSQASASTARDAAAKQRVVSRKQKQKTVSIKRTPVKRTRILATSTPLTRSRRCSGHTFCSLSKHTKSKVSPKKETNGIGAKFVLPSRSIHSSRVIKPNKRFIEQDTNRIIKKRVRILRDESVKGDANSEKKEEEEEKKEDAMSTLSNGKVVLRQARLQLNSHSFSGTEGPFSSNSAAGPSCTVTCGVCGAVRFYRFAKQARKFNIYSCELCRKFITKLIKRTSIKNVSTTLNCHKGQGLCHVPPTVRSQHRKFNGITYNSRCPACWLKLCIRSFQMPMAIKTSLMQLLPKYMQQPGESALFQSALPPLTWQASPPERSSKVETRSVDASASSGSTLRQRPLRQARKVEEKVTQPPPPAPAAVADNAALKRQKVDLKGPRVKHVCRSASIVLGQLPATFPGDSKKTEDCKAIESGKGPSVLAEPPKPCDDGREKETTVSVLNNSGNSNEKLDDVVVTLDVVTQTNSNKQIRDAPTTLAFTKKEKKDKTLLTSMLPMEITKPSFNKKSKKISGIQDNPNLVNIDYWENYDPDEVVCNGYSIISSEGFPMNAICFLCGSAGRETLLHCCICCEPYHLYCLEQEPPNLINSNQKFTWVCPKCTMCSACGETDRQKINCQKCHKAYHPQCFNTKWRTDDRPTVCSNCLRCKSCGTDNITKFVGNLALCLVCFKLRNKGNFCPMCQCCYDDNDFDTKMMECGKCNKWVHAKCEGLTDEQYQILSILPESVEFICGLCCTEATPYWRKAIQLELRSCFNNILKLLSKNRMARELLKLSPLKTMSYQSRPILSARRLEFVDVNDAGVDSDSNSLDSDLEQVNAIFKNKMDFGESSSSNSSLLNDSKLPISPNMVEIKNKLNCNEYCTLREFNEGMEHALISSSSDDSKLVTIYRSILNKVFPWFDPNVKEDCNQSVQDPAPLDKTDDDKKYASDLDLFDVHASNSSDIRMCNLCKLTGDGLPEKEARLLYCGQNEWVHANCALWSSEVYEEIDGSLQNVQSAISRGRSIRCAHCRQKGASVGCCLKGCHETYHFPCAQKANCHFLVDKTVYCLSHDVPDNSNVITNSRDFAICRSVYIELDLKKKKLCDRDRVNFMVGSLVVRNLGKIVATVSDTVDAIIPVGYVCSRLFWSTTEPWKLVPYKITTFMHNAQSQFHIDKNFTVDHSLPKHLVEKKLREITVWQRDDKDRADIYEFEDYEEPQNAADILSPELTDAILEELPHGLLDGLSVQDMLKEYEELMGIDFKNSEINCNDNVINMNNEVNAECDYKELRRSKSEVIQKIEDKIKPRNQQRSCSLAWLQLDNSISPAIKKRKIATSNFVQIVQVDGACDSASECSSPTREMEDDGWAPDADVKCERCDCTYRTKISYERHLETCEPMFTSDSECEEQQFQTTTTTTTEEHVISSFESYSFQSSQQNQIQAATVMNSQAVLESKVQDSGIMYNFQMVKPGLMSQTSQTTTTNVPIDNTPMQYCVNPITSTPIISMNNSHLINSGLIESVTPTYTQEMTPILNMAQQNQQPQAITIDAKMLAPVMNVPQNQWIRPVMAQKNQQRLKHKVVAKRAPKMVQMVPQNSQSLIVQQILPFVDPFQQNGQPNVQYVMAPQVNPQPQLVQMPENNFVSLLPSVQPTMIIQQPRVVDTTTAQLMIDSNGSVVWATQPVPQVQPIYYGFETIVQNTVMQSQQFLPSTVPGVLTTNSSYSATTQVFQTSKLEPVLDGGYVVLNQNQLLNQNQIMNNSPLPVAPISSAVTTNSVQMKPPWNAIEPQMKPVQVAPIVSTSIAPPSTNSCTQSITLPVAPFVPEQQGIPTNIVTPTPKPPATVLPQARPMSRVLPMQTTAVQKPKQELAEEPPIIEKKFIILDDLVFKAKSSSPPLPSISPIPKTEPIKVIKTEEKPTVREENAIPFVKTEEPEKELIKPIIVKEEIIPAVPPTPPPPPVPAERPLKESPKANKIQIMSFKNFKPKWADKENIATGDHPPSELKYSHQKRPNPNSIYYKIESDDGFDCTGISLSQIWRKVFSEVQLARNEHNLPPLPELALRTVNDMDILGVKSKGMRYLLEQLPDAPKCRTYKPLFQKPKDPFVFEDEDDEDGCRRCTTYDNKKEKYDMFGWLSSKHRTLEMYDLDAVLKKNASSSLPMAMRFRALKVISKYSVGVYRSEIHGRGLFSLRDIEAGEMVIEYAGEVIRSVLTDKREKYYNSKNIGCYMFRVDDNFVVDATMKGNAARFINHSCDPNCYSKVVEILGNKHIIIFALRKIICGEELTYDYKFPFEEDKIPCTCGTKRCRKFLN